MLITTIRVPHISDLLADSQSEYRLVLWRWVVGMLADWLRGSKSEVSAKIKMQSVKLRYPCEMDFNLTL
jgi:hypothetical protein